MVEDRQVLQLWTACYAGNTELVQDLIEQDVDFCQRDRNGETVLHMSARSDNSEVVNLLLDHLSPDVTNKNYQTPLHLASSKGHLSVVQVLITADCQLDCQTKYSEMTALHLACQNNRPHIVKALLEAGAVCNSNDTIGKDPEFYTTNPAIHQMFKDHKKHCTHHQHPSSTPNPHNHPTQHHSSLPSHKDPNQCQPSTPPLHNNPTQKPQDTDDDESSRSPDEGDFDKKRVGEKDETSSTNKSKWKNVQKTQKKFKVNHGLGFSEQHKRRMEMNVFDRLMGNKKK